MKAMTPKEQKVLTLIQILALGDQQIKEGKVQAVELVFQELRSRKK
jgi:hypothetical protein